MIDLKLLLRERNPHEAARDRCRRPERRRKIDCGARFAQGCAGSARIADTIASGLSAFRPESVAIAAGRIMLARMQALSAAREDFAFETTLASRSFAPWLARARSHGGYHVHLLFLWLRSPELAVSRVAERVRLGGHHVPDDVVQRRYRRGLVNFFQVYLPLVDSWQFFNNSESGRPEPVAAGDRKGRQVVQDPETWRGLTVTYDE